MKKLLLISFFLLATTAYAQVDYTPLAPIPQLTNSDETVTISKFIPELIKLIIGLAGALAVIYIIIGGIKHMTTEAWGGKKEARETIQNAIIGLLLAIGAYSILYTINPNILKLDLSLTRPTNEYSIDPTTGDFTVFIPGQGTTTLTTKSPEELGCQNYCEKLLDGDHGVNVKTPGACTNKPCYVNSGLLRQLWELADRTDDGETKVGWQVTEAFPPTVNHESRCHTPGFPETGTCVDIGLFTKTNENIAKLFRALNQSSRLDFQYEVLCSDKNNCPRLKEIKDYLATYHTFENGKITRYPEISALASKVVGVESKSSGGNATGEHLHLNFK